MTNAKNHDSDSNGLDGTQSGSSPNAADTARAPDWYLGLPPLLIGLLVAAFGVVGAFYTLVALALPPLLAAVAAGFAAGHLLNRVFLETFGAVLWQLIDDPVSRWPRAALVTILAAVICAIGLTVAAAPLSSAWPWIAGALGFAGPLVFAYGIVRVFLQRLPTSSVS